MHSVKYMHRVIFLKRYKIIDLMYQVFYSTNFPNMVARGIVKFGDIHVFISRETSQEHLIKSSLCL